MSKQFELIKNNVY